MEERDTSIGAGQSAFQATRWGEILELRHRDSAAAQTLTARLAGVYWRPVYKFLRVALRRDNEEAKDLTQDFFSVVFRPEWIVRADPARGRFRTFLLASLKNFVRDSEKYHGARKRGGGIQWVPMEELGNQEPARGVSPEQLFLRSWAEATLAEALEDLRRELDARGRGKMFEAFREYCLEAEPGRDISYRSIREKLGLSESEVTNYISESRRALRLILVGKVGGTVGSPREVDEELGILFGSR